MNKRDPYPNFPSASPFEQEDLSGIPNSFATEFFRAALTKESHTPSSCVSIDRLWDFERGAETPLAVELEHLSTCPSCQFDRARLGEAPATAADLDLLERMIKDSVEEIVASARIDVSTIDRALLATADGDESFLPIFANGEGSENDGLGDFLLGKGRSLDKAA